MRVDMGAYELDNVRLTVTGSATPGGTLTFGTSGTVGMTAFLAIASKPGELLVRPVGHLLFDPSAPWYQRALGTVPGTMSATIPITLPPSTPVVFQVLAIGAPLPSGRSPANLSNSVMLLIE